MEYYPSPKAAAGGGSGLTPGHLKELLAVPSTQLEGELLDGLTSLTTKLAADKMPHHLMKWLAGAPLTPLCKRDGGVRPVAVGETIRRIVSSLLMRRVSTQAQEFLEPIQVRVATGGGTEAIVHATWLLANRFGQDNSRAVLQVDLRNAFNLVNRQALMSGLR